MQTRHHNTLHRLARLVTGAMTAVAALTALTALLATGCSPDKNFLRADTASISIDAEDTSTDFAVVVESSASWMFDLPASGDGWLDVRYHDDNPDLMLVTAKLRNELPEPRSDTITITSGGGLRLIIPVIQSAMVVRFSVTPTGLEPFAAHDVTTQTLTVDTGLTWEALQLNGNWIVLTQGTAEEGNENTLAVGVKRINDFEERRDTIVIRPANIAYHDYADSIAVVQAGSGLLVESQGFFDEETFEFTIPTDGGEVPIWVSCEGAWRVTTDATEGTVSFTIPESEVGDIVNGIGTVMTVAPNLSTEEDNNFSLYFESGGETYEYRCTQPKQTPPEPPEEPEQPE